MRLRQLYLSAFGPFTDKVLDFSQDGHSLFLVHGPNEAGKSSTLRAICDLRYGIPQQSGDNFRHAHPDMRVGGVFVDAGGRTHSLMRRKRRENALTFHDFGSGTSDDVPVPPDIEALLTGGMGRDDYLAMFGIDHQRLREGGRALVRGDGEVGAALFEASAGIRSMPALLQRLDEQAKQFYSRSRSSRINVALGQYTQQHDALRKAVVKPGAWADLSRQQGAAREELDRLHGELEARRGRLLLFTELRAVAPLLATINAAAATLAELADAPVLPEDAGSQRVAIEAKLGEATAGERDTLARIEELKAQLASLTLDDAVLGLGAAIERLAASQEHIDSTARDLREAVGAERAAAITLADAARAIDAAAAVDALVRLAPPPAHRAEIVGALEQVEHAREKLRQVLESLGELDGQ
ncbi:MAG: hypothetical protein JWQ03_3033, partial [Variovorax sp.]|nr:hypothetical protein [Variovorax sp.]